MKADQFLLTFLLATGLIIAGAAAAGPSSSEVRLVLRPRTVQAMDACAARIGKRITKAIGGEKQSLEVRICEASANLSRYRAEPVRVGYRLGESGRGHMALMMSVGIEFVDRSNEPTAPDLSRRVVRRIADSCGRKIQRLWEESRLGASLDLRIDEVTNSDAKFDHTVSLIRDPHGSGGFAMAQWPDRAKMFSSARTDDVQLCKDQAAASAASAQERAAELKKCYHRAQSLAMTENDLFCADLAIMVGHFLGLADELAQNDHCEAQSVTAEAGFDTELDEASPSFMHSAARLRLKGPLFWEKARFTDADRRSIFSPGCQELALASAAPGSVVVK